MNNDLLDEMIADMEDAEEQGLDVEDVSYRIDYKGKPYKVTLTRDPK